MHKRLKVLVAAIALAVGACSFDVTNPGPVADENLDETGAFDPLIRGIRYNIARAISINAFYGAVAAKEYSTSGRVNATKLPLVFGQLSVDDVSANGWNWSQAARWQAEDAQRRLREVLAGGFTSNRFAGQALMYGALANRILGDNFCEAVIDGGAKQAYTVYYTRAETQATEAIAVAGAAGDAATRQAAYAIRAAARLALGNNAGAAADASVANVPTSLSLTAPFDLSTRNLMVDTNDFALGGNFRASTIWRTWFEGYFRTSGDLRVRWDSSTVVTGGVGRARDGEFTGIIWFYQRKYITTQTNTDYGSPIRLVSGREARLIEAEVALRNNDLATAATKINTEVRAGNAVRAGSPALAPWPVTTAAQGWEALRRERSIELWLEGRTMADLRRWVADGTYATFTSAADSDIRDRVRLCLPIARGERQTNSNLSLQPDDPTSPIFNGQAAPW